jgi:TonB family protein
MKSKKLLIIAMALLAGASPAQQGDRPGQKIQTTEAIAMRNLTAAVAPQYPDEMRKQVTGKVVLKILIDEDGKVQDATLLTGDIRLAEATITAVKQWTFRPYILNDQTVEVETTATVEYTDAPPYVATPAPPPMHLPQKLRVSQGAMESNLLHKVQPKYPQEAKSDHIPGDVILQATVDRDGAVRTLRLVYGTPVLAQAALDAVRQWKYRPYTLNGEPVEVETTIKIRFQL